VLRDYLCCREVIGGKDIMDDSDQAGELLALTTEIVAAHVSNNTVAVGDLGQLINQVYQSLANIGSAPAAAAPSSRRSRSRSRSSPTT
jgi:predicted transcriptional regulator